MNYFDSHCHLQMRQFDADRADVLARMQVASVGAVVVGVDIETSRAAVELAKSHNFLYSSVGLHPNEKYIGLPYVELEKLAQDKKVVAIGECGLDYFRGGVTEYEKKTQKESFEKQIQLALKVQKPLIIHCRDSQQRIANIKSAHEDMLEILSSHAEEFVNRGVTAVIHFFTGSAELAQKYLNLGCCLSFPGPITYTDMYDESVRITPLDKILTETDAPFAAPTPHRGRRSEPAYVAEVIRKIATLKNVPFETMSEHIVLNSQRVLSLK